MYSHASPQPDWNVISSKENLKSKLWAEEIVFFGNDYDMINSHNEIILPSSSTTHCGKAT